MCRIVFVFAKTLRKMKRFFYHSYLIWQDKDDTQSVSSSVSASPVPTYTCDYPDCMAVRYSIGSIII